MVLQVIGLEEVWPLQVTPLWWVPIDDDNGYSGSAYVFTRTGTTWTQQAKLTASDGAEMMIGLDGVWPLPVTQLWWVPVEMMTMAHALDRLMFSHAQEPLGLSKPN